MGCLELDPRRKRKNTAWLGRCCIAQRRSVVYGARGWIELNTGPDAADLGGVEDVVGLHLDLQYTLVGAQRNGLCHRRIEISHVRETQSARSAPLLTENGRPH